MTTETITDTAHCHEPVSGNYRVLDLDEMPNFSFDLTETWSCINGLWAHDYVTARCLASSYSVTPDGRLRFAETWKCPQCREVLHLFQTR